MVASVSFLQPDGSGLRPPQVPAYPQERAGCRRGDPDITEKHLPLIHLVFGNLKTWLNGVHHGVSPQHLQAYLNEFTFRLNRRFFPFTAFQSLLGIGAATEPTTYDALYNMGRRPTQSGRESPVGN